MDKDELISMAIAIGLAIGIGCMAAAQIRDSIGAMLPL